MIASLETNIVREVPAVHLVDLNEIEWQPESHGRQTKSVEDGIVLWSFPGPGSYELEAHPHHTWLILRGQGRMQLGQRVIAISGGVVLSDLHDMVASFQVSHEEELVVMDVVIRNSKSPSQFVKSVPPNLPLGEEPPDVNLAPTTNTVEVEEGPTFDDLDTGSIETTPEAMVESVPDIVPESIDTYTSEDPSNNDDQDPPLPWVARLRPR